MTLQETRRLLKPPCQVIDIHVHPFSGLGAFGKEAGAIENAKRILRNADDAGIGTLAVNDIGPGRSLAFPTAAEMREANDNILRIRDSAPDRIVPFVYLAPRLPDESCAELERRFKLGIKGIKLWIGGKASEPGAIQIARMAASLDVPILIHCYMRTDGNLEGETSPMDAVAMAKAAPGVKIVLAHFSFVGLRGIEEIRAFPNISVDTSGGDPVRGFTGAAVARLGSKRVIFGSDVPCRHFGTQLGKVLDNGLSDSETQDILYGNAAALLKIGRAGK